MPEHLVYYVEAAYGWLFVSAGISKLLRQRAFRNALRAHRLLPPRAVAPAARTITLAELIVGSGFLVGLAVPVLTRITAAAALLLLVLFTVTIARAVLHGYQFRCRCGLILGDHLIGWRVVARDVTLASILVVLMFG